MKPLCLSVIAAFVFLVAMPTYASDTIGTIQGANTFAWGENLGWINFNPANGGLIISDTAISGYVWSRQFGWINFSPSRSGQGVSNTNEGVLSGSAWIAGKGWLDMNGVTIDVEGRFSGTAGEEGTSVGRVSFDCAQCEVVTDWRPLSMRSPRQPSSGPQPSVPEPSEPPSSTFPPAPVPSTATVVPAAPLNPPLTPPQTAPVTPRPQRNPETVIDENGFVEAHNEPLTLYPHQSGSLIQEFDDGSFVRIDIVSGASTEHFTIDVKPVPIDFRGYDPSIRPIGNYFFDITAYDTEGKLVQQFDAPLKITLPLAGAGNIKETLGVYWLDEATGEWVRVPAAAFTESAAIFYINHLGRFAILNAPGNPERIYPESPMLRNFLIFGLPSLVLLAGAAFHWGFRKPRVTKAAVKKAKLS